MKTFQNAILFIILVGLKDTYLDSIDLSYLFFIIVYVQTNKYSIDFLFFY